MIPLKEIVGDWDAFLLSVFSEPAVIANMNNIDRMYHAGERIYPEQIDVFKAFQECPIDKLSVVILLQDPYHDGSATGIAMANEPNTRLSPSLKIVKDNICRTIYKGREFDFDPTLVKWARQGVLLLNTALTVEAGKPLSHKFLWARFTQCLLAKLSEQNSGIIYCLWGLEAKKLEYFIHNKVSNTILYYTHPVSAAYSGSAWDCDHFVKINEQLKCFNNTTIIW